MSVNGRVRRCVCVVSVVLKALRAFTEVSLLVGVCTYMLWMGGGGGGRPTCRWKSEDGLDGREGEG